MPEKLQHIVQLEAALFTAPDSHALTSEGESFQAWLNQRSLLDHANKVNNEEARKKGSEEDGASPDFVEQVQRNISEHISGMGAVADLIDPAVDPALQFYAIADLKDHKAASDTWTDGLEYGIPVARHASLEHAIEDTRVMGTSLSKSAVIFETRKTVPQVALQPDTILTDAVIFSSPVIHQLERALVAV